MLDTLMSWTPHILETVLSQDRAPNLATERLHGGAAFYNVYRTKDDQYVSFGSIEPQFYAELMRLTGLAGDSDFAKQHDRSQWPALKERLGDLVAAKTREEWNALMEMTDVCYAPVLTMSEAAQHPHNVARETFIEVGGITQPAPAPRFSRSVPATPAPPAHPGQHSAAVLADWGLAADAIDALLASGAVKQA